MRRTGLRWAAALAIVLAAASAGAHLVGSPVLTSGASDAWAEKPPSAVASEVLAGRGRPLAAPTDGGLPAVEATPAPGAPLDPGPDRLPPASVSSIAGRVLLADGAPCTDATVGTYGSGLSAVTGADGGFRIEGVPARELVDLYVTCFGRVRGPPQRLDGVKPGTDTLEIRLAPSATIEGVVVEADGTPATEGFVHVSRADGTSIVEDFGGGTFAIRPGGRFTASGLPPGLHVVSARSWYVEVPGFAVDAPARDVRIVLPRRHLVSGRLIGTGDLGGFHLVAHVPPEPGTAGERTAGRATSDADGSFRIQLRYDGPYEVVVMKSGDDRHARTTDVSQGTATLALPLVAGLAIEGTVAVEGGTALPGDLWITASGAESHRSAPAVRPGPQGRWRVSGLFPGVYRVEVASYGSVGAQTSQDGIAAGATEVRLILPPP